MILLLSLLKPSVLLRIGVLIVDHGIEAYSQPFTLVEEHCYGSITNLNAALERTYLAFIRTSSHLASAGITIGQLFILHDDRRVLGKVLATIIIVCAIVTTLLGAVEYFRQHRALDNVSVYKSGTVLSTTSNMLAMAVIVLLVCGALFVVILVTT